VKMTIVLQAILFFAFLIGVQGQTCKYFT